MSSSLITEEVLEKLKTMYQSPRSFLQYKTPLDLLVATVLSAQCTDAVVNRVTEKLFKKYRTPKDYIAVPRKELEKDIHSCGTYRNKAKYIQELSQMIIDQYKSEVPDTMESLTTLPGVGRKTAAIILWAIFSKNEGIAVDTHVERLARRMGLTKKKTPEGVEKDLMASLPKKQWGEITALLISHGRAVCTARKRNCEQCAFKDNCPSSLVLGKKDLGR